MFNLQIKHNKSLTIITKIYIEILRKYSGINVMRT